MQAIRSSTAVDGSSVEHGFDSGLRHTHIVTRTEEAAPPSDLLRCLHRCIDSDSDWELGWATLTSEIEEFGFSRFKIRDFTVSIDFVCISVLSSPQYYSKLADSETLPHTAATLVDSLSLELQRRGYAVRPYATGLIQGAMAIQDGVKERILRQSICTSGGGWKKCADILKGFTFMRTRGQHWNWKNCLSAAKLLAKLLDAAIPEILLLPADYDSREPHHHSAGLPGIGTAARPEAVGLPPIEPPAVVPTVSRLPAVGPPAVSPPPPRPVPALPPVPGPRPPHATASRCHERSRKLALFYRELLSSAEQFIRCDAALCLQELLQRGLLQGLDPKGTLQEGFVAMVGPSGGAAEAVVIERTEFLTGADSLLSVCVTFCAPDCLSVLLRHGYDAIEHADVRDQERPTLVERAVRLAAQQVSIAKDQLDPSEWPKKWQLCIGHILGSGVPMPPALFSLLSEERRAECFYLWVDQPKCLQLWQDTFAQGVSEGTAEAVQAALAHGASPDGLVPPIPADTSDEDRQIYPFMCRPIYLASRRRNRKEALGIVAALLDAGARVTHVPGHPTLLPSLLYEAIRPLEDERNKRLQKRTVELLCGYFEDPWQGERMDMYTKQEHFTCGGRIVSVIVAGAIVGGVSQVRRCLDHPDYPPNALFWMSMALQAALMHRQRSVVRELLSRGVNPQRMVATEMPVLGYDAPWQAGAMMRKQPLELQVLTGRFHVEGQRDLVSHGALPTECESLSLRQRLHTAARLGDVEGVRELVSSGDCPCSMNAGCLTPTDVAFVEAVHGRTGLEALQELLSLGYEAAQFRPFQKAQGARGAKSGPKFVSSALRLALKHGADPDAPCQWLPKQQRDWRLLDVAAYYGYVTLARELIAQGNGMDQGELFGCKMHPLHRAVQACCSTRRPPLAPAGLRGLMHTYSSMLGEREWKDMLSELLVASFSSSNAICSLILLRWGAPITAYVQSVVRNRVLWPGAKAHLRVALLRNRNGSAPDPLVVSDSVLWHARHQPELRDASKLFPSRRLHVLRWRRAHQAQRDARLVFRAAALGRPLELYKRLVLGKWAGGLTRPGEVGGVEMKPLAAALAGGHEACVKVLIDAGAGI